jgi:hypothetical protein
LLLGAILIWQAQSDATIMQMKEIGAKGTAQPAACRYVERNRVRGRKVSGITPRKISGCGLKSAA